MFARSLRRAAGASSHRLFDPARIALTSSAIGDVRPAHVWTYGTSCRPCKPRGSACVTLTAVQPISGVRPNASAALQSSPDARTRTASSNNAGISVRKSNLGRANEVAYCESCAVSAGPLGNCGRAKGAHRVRVKTIVWYMQAGVSVVMDILGEDLQMVVRGILPQSA
jgi:hypothetical protein